MNLAVPTKIKKKRKRGVVVTYKGLEKLQEARLKLEREHNWGERYTYEKLSELSYLDLNTIKKILAAKEGVDKRTLEIYFLTFNLKLTPEDYMKPNPNKRQDWGEAVCVTEFLGRTSEINILEKWLLRDRCRLVTIQGMGGVGKTFLSIKLAQQTQDKFDCIIWRSLRDVPLLKELLADIIQFLSNGQVTEVDLQKTIGGRISCLIDYFRSLRCLLVLDNLESLLSSNVRAGVYREEYKGYDELFRRLGETKHQSCLLLTTREKPKQIAALEGEIFPVRTLKLSGFQGESGAEILKKKGLNGSQLQFNKLVRRYDGNVLSLKIVSTTILDLFGGDVQKFLCEEMSVFGDLRDLLDQQFERLSPLEKDIIYWLAINREPITLSQLQEDMVLMVPRLTLMEGLESLSRRSLIVQNEACFTLQSVVMEYVIRNLINTVCQEIKIQKLQFFNHYALMKATAKDYVRETQIRLIVRPLIEGLMTIFKSQESLEKRLTQILATLRETSSPEPGYTAGNILNLLCLMKTDLRGYDFSNLTVWQADLRFSCLHHVNFQNTDLAKSLFAEAFGGIWSVAYSPDGQYLATGDTKGDILLRRMTDGQSIRRLKGHNGWIVSLAFSPDGKTIASSSCDCTAKLWDIDTGQCLHTLQEHEQEVWSVAYSPDGKTLASGCDDSKLRLWSVDTGECLQVFSGHTHEVLSVAFSIDGQKLISGSQDRTIKLWDINTGECKHVFQGHDDGIRSVSVIPDGKTLASGSNDCTVRLWNIKTGECLQVFSGHSNVVLCVSINPQSNLLASSSIDHTVRLWNIKTGECLQVLSGHSNVVNSVAFNLQDDILGSGSYDQTVKLWDVKTYKCLKSWQGSSNQALSVTFSGDGQTLVSGGHDKKVRLWDVKTGRVMKTFQGHTNWVFSVAFNPQSNLLASSSGDKTVKLWNVKTGKAINTFRGHKAVVRSVAFSSDNQILASGSEDRTIRLWNTNSGQLVKVLRGHQAEVWSTAFSPDGQILASCSFDGTVRLWNVESGECFKTLDEHTSWVWSVAFSPDNTTLATTSADQTIRLWNINTGKCPKILREDRGHSELIAFSVDGRTLASCSQDHSIRLWNVQSGKCFKTLNGHTALINSIAFNPDNRTLVSSSEDETIKLWNLKSGECIRTLTVEKPYEFMNVMGVTGLSEANINMLKTLGTTNALTNV